MRIGLDVGSTTVKLVVLDDEFHVVFSAYERHRGKTVAAAGKLIDQTAQYLPGGKALLAVTGSAGLGLAERLKLPFVQEVYATREALMRNLPDTDVAVELGGEDAKILFLTGGAEVRMNGSCAGGTGAFLDQMATLLNITTPELSELAMQAQRIYPIASRCGVFAKSDIQPLINQGAKTADICKSILAAVVDQTIAGLAQGRPIEGNVAYLGGPLSFSKPLRERFDEVLKTKGTCPENALYYAALGAAYAPDAIEIDLGSLERLLSSSAAFGSYTACDPLFTNQDEYAAFSARHAAAGLPRGDAEHVREAFLGIDAGSTTVKLAVIDENDNLLFSAYDLNRGNPVPPVQRFLTEFYRTWPNIRIVSSATTGYGEELLKNAFQADYGLVETVAHFTAAKKLMPEVETIIDIGGQDIKCFRIKNGAIDSIYLNEACSSGCGSFLQTFASALGYSMQDFAKMGLFAEHPVDLGSRCTVFMNSSVKQAQKDGAKVEDISAGLSISVVKNVLYKVLRAASPRDLGTHIVVQGGTFLNDAVLRAFEMETGCNVTRPADSGVMGAYGAALYARAHRPERSTLLDAEGLKQFTYETKGVVCRGCTNHCPLTVTTFGGGSGVRRFIGGNRCDKPVKGQKSENPLNLYADKRVRILQDSGKPASPVRRVGIPLGLNMYELLPFWRAFFEKLGMEVVVSPLSDKNLYRTGQSTIPSDTACYPAKMMHGHVEYLCEAGVDAVFYPCMSYNMDEGQSDNHYNCPVVAYYPEVLKANMPKLRHTPFIYDYLGLDRRKDFPNKVYTALVKHFPELKRREVAEAASCAYRAYEEHMHWIRERGQEIIAEARKRGMPIIILSGRPYHVDPEISHLIDRMIAELGVAVVSEDAVSHLGGHPKTRVLNQWTYHARLYAAAKYVATQPDMQLVQLVSFGCGVDAITTDEVRELLEESGKLYTQIKIDEIANLGAARIRMRSLLAAAQAEKEMRVV